MNFTATYRFSQSAVERRGLFTATGIICDKKAGFCANSEGITLAFTGESQGVISRGQVFA